MPFFSPEQLAQLAGGLADVPRRRQQLTEDYLTHRFADKRAQEFARHGFLRRLATQTHCIHRVFQILPPEREDLPTKEELREAEVHIQASLLSVFGAIDDLAWVWVTERRVTNGPRDLTRRQVGLSRGHDIVRQSLPAGLRKYVVGSDAWFDALGDYRDALAHRIPLYIPPYTVPPAKAAEHEDLARAANEALRRGDWREYERLDQQQQGLGSFAPFMQHSFGEGTRPMAFHAQLLANFLTVAEFASRMLAELREAPEG